MVCISISAKLSSILFSFVTKKIVAPKNCDTKKFGTQIVTKLKNSKYVN